MSKQRSQSMISWILWNPLKFALCSFLLFVLVGAVLGYISQSMPISNSIFNTSLIVVFIISAFLMFRAMPRDGLDRFSFIALNNAQNVIVSVAFAILTALIVTHANEIMFKLMLIETHASASFVAIMSVVAIFYLYLCGLFLSNVYAKFRRGRAMGLKSWQIICTMPMCFSLVWVPGYLLPDNEKSPSRKVHIKSSWYTKLTEWIVSGRIKTITSLIVVILLSGLFFGLNAIALTLTMAVISAIWIRVSGQKNFTKHIGGKYAWFAIIMNIILLVALCIIIINTTYGNNDITMNIADTVPVTGTVN